MTSTTLKSKSSSFAPALKKTFKNGLGNIIAISILSIAVGVLAVTSCIFNNAYGVSSKTTYDFSTDAIIIFLVMAVVCMLFGIFAAGKLFKEAYKKQSCDLYFALPIRREDYYFSAYIYTAVLNLIGMLVPTLIFICTMPLMSTKAVTFTMVWEGFFGQVIPVMLAVFAYMSAFIMCAVTAGRRIHYTLLVLVCLFAPSAILSGVIGCINSIWGMSVDTIIPFCIDPFTSAFYNVFAADKDIQLPMCLISSAEIIGMFFAGLIVFKKRKAEVAEVSLAGKILPYVFLALTALAGFMRYAGYTPIIAIAAGCIFAVLLTMAFSGIFYKKVFTKNTGITVGAVCLAGVILVGAFNFPSYSSYVKNIPESSEVESIEISNLSFSTVYLSFLTNILNEFDVEADIYSGFEVKSEKGIADTIALHQKLVDDDVIKESKSFSKTPLMTMLFDGSFWESDYEETYDVRLTYNLKSGGNLTRTYSVSSKYIINEYYELMKNEEILSQLPDLNYNQNDILYLYADSYSYDDEYDEEIVDGEEVADTEAFDESCYEQKIDVKNWDSFKKAYIKDLQKLEKNDFLDAVYTLSGFNGITGSYDMEEDYAWDTYVDDNHLADITVWYIDTDAPEDVKEEIKKMSLSEIQKIHEGYMLEEDLDSETNSIYAYTSSSTISVDESQTETVKLLKDLGIIFQ